ncbi:caspase recruitment domain-containing protein 10-like isoform X2 [Apostichopus japonicus]|uniref:caspase recruitment domain-containing protein 10-like isoform X2 n=1 Tax=Stichopus japonicus TaxID=307972 RepID=UPI003AB24DC1
MSFNDECLEKLDEFRTRLVALDPRPFVDELRSLTVLNKDDAEQILNEHRNPTTTQKMGEMLDVLKTKGTRGYNVFIKILGKFHGELYTNMTGKIPPESPLEITDSSKYWPPISVPTLDQVTAMLKELRNVETELLKMKTTNGRLSKEKKELQERIALLWRRCRVEKEKNLDRDRLEAERNDMMEQLTSVTGKALSYKEELEIANSNLHELRLNNLQVKRELEKAQRGLKQQRQKSLQIERTYSQSNSRIREELQEKVSKLEEELKKIDQGQHHRISQPASMQNFDNLTNTPINQQLLQLQTDLEIMTNDRDQAIRKAEDATERAYSIIRELHSAEEKLAKFSQERDDLLITLETQKDEAEMQKRFVMLAEHQLARATEERKQALTEKNSQTEKCARLMLQRDKLIQEQRSLRAEMTTQMERLTSANTRLVKYKRRYRNTSIKLHGEYKQDTEEDTASTSSEDLNDKASYDLAPQPKELDPPEEKTDVSTSSDKRSSNATTVSSHTTSSEIASSGHMHDSDDLEEITPRPRDRAHAFSKDNCERRPSDDLIDGCFSKSDFPDGASTDEDSISYWTSCRQRGRTQNDSTKVHVNNDEFPLKNPLIGFESLTGSATKPVRRRERKHNNGLKRRSKSFNDLSSLSLEDELNIDLEFDLPFQDHQGSRSGSSVDGIRERSLRLINWFSSQKKYQRRRAKENRSQDCGY